MRYYLAHPALNRKSIRKWELKIEKKYGIELLNPFYDVIGVESEDIKKQDLEGEWDGKGYGYQKSIKIVKNDIDMIKRCDGVIAIVDGTKSYGTIMEIVYGFINSKDVYIITTNKSEGHPWFVTHSDKIFTSYKDFEKWLNWRYKK